MNSVAMNGRGGVKFSVILHRFFYRVYKECTKDSPDVVLRERQKDVLFIHKHICYCKAHKANIVGTLDGTWLCMEMCEKGNAFLLDYYFCTMEQFIGILHFGLPHFSQDQKEPSPRLSPVPCTCRQLFTKGIPKIPIASPYPQLQRIISKTLIGKSSSWAILCDCSSREAVGYVDSEEPGEMTIP